MSALGSTGRVLLGKTVQKKDEFLGVHRKEEKAVLVFWHGSGRPDVSCDEGPRRGGHGEGCETCRCVRRNSKRTEERAVTV